MKVAKHVQKPNFFIIGAPKCGTTALSEYLREHPDVHFSYPKEPNFFCTDFSEQHREFKDYTFYLNQCFYNSKGKTAVGEGSVYYLYSSEAVPNILKFQPKAKFIVMLRNPVDIAHSLHATHLRSGINENIEDFETAWNLQDERKEGKNLPPHCTDYKLVMYRDICKTGEQLKRLFQWVDKSKVKIILFEDFVNDTLKVYKEVLDFLNVKYDGREEFPNINYNFRSKSKVLAKIIHKLSYKFAWILLVKKKIGIPEGFSLLGPVKRLNSEKSSRKELDTAFREKLVVEFRDDVSLLEKLINRDLSHWKYGGLK
ncbi:MAG: sulfotransferase family protein [Bacteroidales bacterium]